MEVASGEGKQECWFGVWSYYTDGKGEWIERVRWYGHVLRRDDGHVLRKVLELISLK